MLGFNYSTISGAAIMAALGFLSTTYPSLNGFIYHQGNITNHYTLIFTNLLIQAYKELH